MLDVSALLGESDAAEQAAEESVSQAAAKAGAAESHSFSSVPEGMEDFASEVQDGISMLAEAVGHLTEALAHCVDALAGTRGAVEMMAATVITTDEFSSEVGQIRGMLPAV